MNRRQISFPHAHFFGSRRTVDYGADEDLPRGRLSSTNTNKEPGESRAFERSELCKEVS